MCYSPAIGIDADRMVKDFPNIRILHIVRNPFSAYRDTKRRPFPQPLTMYLITWNIYHSTVEMFSKMYPDNVRVMRYEDLVEDKRQFMIRAADFIGVPFNEKMLYPSWNAWRVFSSRPRGRATVPEDPHAGCGGACQSREGGCHSAAPLRTRGCPRPLRSRSGQRGCASCHANVGAHALAVPNAGQRSS